MYREVTMFEVKEALRLWLGGTPKKRIAAQLGLDPKTVRHYVAVGAGTYSSADHGAGAPRSTPTCAPRRLRSRTLLVSAARQKWWVLNCRLMAGFELSTEADGHVGVQVGRKAGAHAADFSLSLAAASGAAVSLRGRLCRRNGRTRSRYQSLWNNGNTSWLAFVTGSSPGIDEDVKPEVHRQHRETDRDLGVTGKALGV